jgi:hypothetical protein
MPNALPYLESIPDQPQETYYIKQCLRELNTRMNATENLTQEDTAEKLVALQALLDKLTLRLGTLERAPAPAAVELPTEACRVYNSSSISLAQDAEVILTFNSTRYDTAGMHSTSSNTSRLTCVKAGKYQIGASVQISNSDADAMWVWAAIRLNGTTYIAEFANSSAGFNGRVNPNTQYQLAVGDYVEVKVRQNNTDADTEIAAVVGNSSPEFWAHRLS